MRVQTFFAHKEVRSKQAQSPIVFEGPTELTQPPQSMLAGFAGQRCSVSTLPSQCGNPICDKICFKVNLLLFSPYSWSHSSDEMRLCLATSVLLLFSPSRLRSCCSEVVEDEPGISISELGGKSPGPPVKGIVKLRLPENLATI